MIDPMRIRPLRRKMLVEAWSMVPLSEWSPGLSDALPDYHPLEVPAYVRKRMLDFLEARYPIPPAYLESLMPASEVQEARSLYRTLKAGGMQPGEAMLAMGIFRRPRYNVAKEAVARIERVGAECRCREETGGDYVIIPEVGGEVIDGNWRIVGCEEVVCGTTAQVFSGIQQAKRATETRKREALGATGKFRVA